MRLLDPRHRRSGVAMIAIGISFAILFPEALFRAAPGWIWNTPGRNFAFEHMLMAVYITLGLFLIWGARDPIRFLPIIDFTIVSGFFHATVMFFDASQMPSMADHLTAGGDVVGTYIAPVVLTLFHPRLIEVFARLRKREGQPRDIPGTAA